MLAAFLKSKNVDLELPNLLKFTQMVKFTHILIGIIASFTGFLKQCYNTLFQINTDIKFQQMPGPPSLPFFGTLFYRNLLPPDLKKSNELLHKTFGNIVKTETYFNVKVINVMDGDLIENALNKYSKVLDRPPIDIVLESRKLKDSKSKFVGIMHSYEEEWIMSRKIINETFASPKFTMSLTEPFNEIVNDYITLLKEESSSSNFFSTIEKMTAECICYSIYNKRMGFLELPNMPERCVRILTCSKEFWDSVAISYAGFPFWKYLPTKTWNNFCEKERALFKLFEELVLEEVKKKEYKGFIQQVMINYTENWDKKITVTMDALNSGMAPIQISFFWLLYFIGLKQNKKVLDKLMVELRQILPNKNSRLENDSVNHLQYLKACLKESFRVCPSTPNLSRFSAHEVEIGGYIIPPYTGIMFQLWHANLQDSNFYKAKEFLPERWLVSAVDRAKGKFSPHRPGLCRHFGSGKRICPGQRFSMHEMTAIAAKVLRTYHLEFSTIEAHYTFFNIPKEPFKVNITEYPD